MKVIVDIDSTLNDFGKSLIYEVERIGYEFRTKDFKEFHFERYIKAPYADQEKIKNYIFSKDSFWRNLPVKEAAFEGLDWLNNNHKVIIVTSPWVETVEHYNLKINWMLKHFPYIKKEQIFFSDKKWEIASDVIIDDKPETLINCKKVGMVTIAPLEPYNRHTHCDYHLRSWRYIKRIMSKVEEI